MIVLADDVLRIGKPGVPGGVLVAAQIVQVAVLPEHPVRHIVQDQLEHLLGVLQRLFRPLPLGDVFHHRHIVQGAALGVLHQAHREVHPGDLPVLPDVSIFRAELGDLSGPQLLHLFDVLGQIVKGWRSR